MQIDTMPTVKELKYDKLVNGHKDFWKGLNRNTLSEFLDWLYNSGLYIHYITLNNLYYAVVDIVDCLWDVQPQFCFSEEWVFMIKSALYLFHFPAKKSSFLHVNLFSTSVENILKRSFHHQHSLQSNLLNRHKNF